MSNELVLDVAALTDVGRLRDHNEDNLGVLDTEHLYVVADGMGGHAAGEVASQIAIESLLDYVRESSEGGDATVVESLLEAGIKRANLRIFEQGSQDSTRKGMGTTIVALKIEEETAHLAHVGDSRIYLYRGDELMLMTRDHSWYADLLASKHNFNPQTLAYAARYKNVITRALGMEEIVEVDLNTLSVLPGDIFLLCSDGLHDMLPDEEISLILSRDEPLDARCQELINAANNAGGQDNISIILVRASQSEAGSDEEE